MAVGVSGWGQNREARPDRDERVDAHSGVKQAELDLVQQQVRLRAALMSSADDVEGALTSLTQAEDALIAARRAWAAAADIAGATTAPASPPLSMPKVSEAVQRQLRQARRPGPARPGFTFGSWV